MTESTKMKLDRFIEMKRKNPKMSKADIAKAVSLGNATMHNYRSYLREHLGEDLFVARKYNSKRGPYKKQTPSITPIEVPLIPASSNKIMVLYCTPQQAMELIHGQ
jgi:hypothetical protein